MGRWLPDDRFTRWQDPESEAIEIGRSATECQLMDFDDVLAVLRHREIQHSATAFDQQVISRLIGNDQHGVQLGIDPARRTINNNPFPFFCFKSIVIDRLDRHDGIA